MTKVIVDRTGFCAGSHYEAGVPVELPDEVVVALGAHAKVVGGAKLAPANAPVIKAAKPKKNRMIAAAPVNKGLD